MKRILFLKIMRSLTSTPALKRKLKILLAVGFVGFMVMSGLVIWAGVAGFNYIANISQNVNPLAKVESLKTEIQELPAIAKLGCWDKAQSLLSFEPWLEKPIAENFKNLKLACSKARTPLCNGADCNAVQGETDKAMQRENI